jgi:hypothetical protein
MRISHHIDLYHYWLAKRASRSMPARRDLDSADIPAVLPHLMIVDKVDGQVRWRLVGTTAVREIGRDPTGSIVGESSAASRAIYERVFTTAHPIFATCEFKAKSGGIINMSLLTLPLSDDGANVNMAISTLVSCFNLEGSASTGWLDSTASTDWLKGQPVKLGDVVDVAGLEELEKLCLDWERHCGSGNDAAEGAC